MKILFICLSGAGDVLTTTPLIREIRLAYKDAQIDVLVMQGAITKDILKNNKDVNNITYFNFMKEGLVKSLLFCKKFRKNNYDLSITGYPHARVHYSIISWFIGAKRRIGFNYKSQKLKLNKLFFTDTLNEDENKPVVENGLEVLKILNIKRKTKPRLIFDLDKEDIEFANEYFKKNKIKRAVLVHPGSGKTKNFMLKQWDKNRFAELVKKIYEKYKVSIIVTGGPDEEDLKKYVIKKSGLKPGQIFNLSEKINRDAAIIRKCELVISNDTIVGHVAAAMGTMVIGLYGPTRPENTSPYTNKKYIICKNAEGFWEHGRKGITQEQAASMKKIQVKDVLDVVDKFLK